jgi:N-acetylglucosamine malate deacetylase 2
MTDLCAAAAAVSGSSALFVFSHPDDDVFVGGTLSFLVRSGVRLDAAWMTSGGYDGREHAREEEIRRAMDIVGIARQHLLRLPDGGMIGVLEEACTGLRQLISDVKPRTVIGPAFEGGHADHDATSFAIAEACRRDGWNGSLLEYPCYAPDAGTPNRLRLAAFPADTRGVRQVDLDEAAVRCKESMVQAYASQKDVFELLGWRPTPREFLRECPPDRDHRVPPCAGLDSYAHWFNWRSPHHFHQLAAAVAAVTTLENRTFGAPASA